MSYLLETLGRGLLGRLRDAFPTQLPEAQEGKDVAELSRRHAQCPTSLDLTVRLGAALLWAGQLGRARELFELARRRYPRAIQPRLGMACVFDELGWPENALSELEQVRQIDGRDPAVAFAIGLCHERLGRRGEARTAYRTSLKLCPRLRNGYERLTAMALCEGRLEDALGWQERLVELEPDDREALLSLGALQLVAGCAAEAVAPFQRALLVEPECLEEAVCPSGPIENEQQLAEAIERVRRSLESYPGLSELHVQLGDLLVKAGEDEEALRHYRTATELAPGFFEAAVKLGAQHLRQGRYLEAAHTFHRAAGLNDRLVLAFVGLGLAQQACGREHESAATFDLACGLEPNSALLLCEGTRLMMRAGCGQSGGAARSFSTARRAADSPGDGGGDEPLLEALRRCQMALEQRPHEAELWWRCGVLLRQVGKIEQAISAMRRAVAIYPPYRDGRLKLALYLRAAGRGAEALSQMQAAFALSARDAELHYDLALLFTQPARFDLAVDRFESGREDEPAMRSFRPNLALALANLGLVDRTPGGRSGLWEPFEPICEPEQGATGSGGRRSTP
jgi:superkiller protein 3